MPPASRAGTSYGHVQPAGRGRPASPSTSAHRADESYGIPRPGEISARMEAVSAEPPGRTPPATPPAASPAGPPAAPPSPGRMQPTGYVDAGRPAPDLPSYPEPSQRGAGTSGYPVPGARPAETPGRPGAAGQRPAERTGYGTSAGNGYGTSAGNGYGTSAGNGYGNGTGYGTGASYGNGAATGFGPQGYSESGFGPQGYSESGFGPQGYSESGRRAVESGYVAPVAFGPNGAPVDRRSVESGYMAPVARSDDLANGGGRRHADDRLAWQDPASQNGSRSGSHARPDPTSDSPSGSHAAGRSVSDLLASHGGTASPRRRRRRED
ncbi:hypothetical protein [Actinophytocola sp.]|uniref:hypothetical protein n=1 Tax=Actinophytocola sp. TaxID=1872138 RepID=UPI003D6C2ABC